MEKITIAYVIDFITQQDGLSGGTERQVLETIENLDRNRFEPILICLRQNEQYSAWQHIDCRRYTLHVGSLLSIQGLSALFRLREIFRTNSVCIVSTFFFDATVFGVIAAKLIGVKCIISCRRDMGFWYTPGTLRTLRFTNMLADRVLANSQAIKANIVEREYLKPEKVDVIYNGIYAHRFAKFDLLSELNDMRREIGIPDNNRIVGITANFNRRVKRVDLFIEAASIVLKEFKEAVFVIFGDGSLRAELENLTRHLKIEDKVHFIGFHNDAIRYISLFDVGVVASDSEGFSNAILEYAAAGIPVVSTDVGGCRELFAKGDLGELVPVDDAQKLANGVLKIVRDPRRMDKIAKFSKRLIKEEFNWSNKITEIEDYYQSLLDNND